MHHGAVRQPFFILGTARCGSTRLHQILNAHPHVFLTNEARVLDVVHFFCRYASLPKAENMRVLLDTWHDIRGVLPEPHVEVFSEVVRRHARGMVEDFYALSIEDPQVTHWGDKLPSLTAARAVLEVLPASKYIVLVRDPRDAWCSWSRFSQRPAVVEGHPAAAAVGLDEFAINWRNVYHSTREYFPNALHLRYEDLVTDTRASMARVLGHLGLPWHAGIDEAIAAKRELAHHATAPSPIESIDRWCEDLDDADVETIDSVCGSVMAEFGYARAARSRDEHRE